MTKPLIALVHRGLAIRRPSTFPPPITQSFLFRSASSLTRNVKTFSPTPATSPASTTTTKMGFGDVKTAAGVKALNDFLAEKAYIEGFVPSQVDVAVFEAMGKAPGADMAHALR